MKVIKSDNDCHIIRNDTATLGGFYSIVLQGIEVENGLCLDAAIARFKELTATPQPLSDVEKMEEILSHLQDIVDVGSYMRKEVLKRKFNYVSKLGIEALKDSIEKIEKLK